MKLAAGNWKMNGTCAELDLIRALVGMLDAPACQVVICPPATLIERAHQAVKGSNLLIGAQDCHAAKAGAHTGDLSATMLADAGASMVILGHSERRTDHGETNAIVQAKARSVVAQGLTAIICVGETGPERDADQTLAVVGAQLSGSLPDDADPARIVIAYEPVWAIGTGRTPTPDQIAEVHVFLRTELTARLGPDADANKIRLLYGGSVNAANAAAIFALPQVDGALVGGASLNAAGFAAIIDALDRAA